MQRDEVAILSKSRSPERVDRPVDLAHARHEHEHITRPAVVHDVLDRIRGALESAQRGLAEARRGEGIPLSELSEGGDDPGAKPPNLAPPAAEPGS